MTRELPWYWLGRVHYPDAVRLLEEARREVLAGGPDRLFLCEHWPVVSLGRHANEANLLSTKATLAASGIELCHSTRGGDLTYHGPGQLMIYPVMGVGVRVRAMLEATGQALARLVESCGVPGATWREDPAGLWLGKRKLAACGLHVHRGVCIHGFALNLKTPPEQWRHIVPCGLNSSPLSMLEAGAGPSSLHVRALAAEAAREFAESLGYESVAGCWPYRVESEARDSDESHRRTKARTPRLQH